MSIFDKVTMDRVVNIQATPEESAAWKAVTDKHMAKHREGEVLDNMQAKYDKLLDDYYELQGKYRKLEFDNKYPNGYIFEYNYSPADIESYQQRGMEIYIMEDGWASGSTTLTFDGCLDLFGEDEIMEFGLAALYPSYGHDTPLDLNKSDAKYLTHAELKVEGTPFKHSYSWE